MASSGSSAVQRLKERAVQSVPSGLVDSGLQFLHRLPVRNGTVVYERDWDVLCVLDACRLDMYREVIGPCERLRSVASTSTVWMDTTFADRWDDEVARTAYVSANPYSHRLDESRFALVDHTWQDAWDDDLGTIPPEPVTDRGIAARREGHERVICHYMQPHFPAIAEGHEMGRLSPSGFGIDDDGTEAQNPWRLLEDGELDREDVVAAYYANLERVFESVAVLLENVDGTVAITADHGNAMGEFGMWGHRAYVPIAPLRDVPWDVRECTDAGTHDPEVTLGVDEDTDDEAIQERLRALGYAE